MNKIRIIVCIILSVSLMTLGFAEIKSLTSVASDCDCESERFFEEGVEADITNPDHIIGTGTPESCTGQAFIEAVAIGGVIVFDGGDEPFTITLTEPAKVFNDQSPDVIIDGGGLVTLSGGNETRILYMNTCDPNLVWMTTHCQDQAYPRLTVQNLTFANGNSTNETEYTGGGAIWVRGGRFQVINCTFINNRCIGTGPDVGGGAIRVFNQYKNEPVYLIDSTFGGAPGLGNIGSNGGAISSIGVSWVIDHCVFSYNEAIGNGGNPAQSGTVGGGSGGAIYNDGNEMTLEIIDSKIEYNKVNAYGSGIFFVTNNHTGDIILNNSTVENNIGGSWYPVVPEISMHSDTKITIIDSNPMTTPDTPIVMTALPSNHTVVIDGESVAFEAYLIGGNNYFKLRDVAAAVNGSNAEFEITWYATTGEIELFNYQTYTFVGGELLVPINSSSYECVESFPDINMANQPIDLTTYLIHDNNFVKLRDIGRLMDFNVSWDGVNELVLIDSNSPYDEN